MTTTAATTAAAASDYAFIANEKPRYSIIPIVHSDVYAMYAKQEACHWTASDIPYSADLDDWDNRLSADERAFVETILGFFAGADNIVLQNAIVNFTADIPVPEAQAFYAIQAQVEVVHSITYGQHIETLVREPERREQLFNAIENDATVTRKTEWCYTYMDQAVPLHRRIFGFAVVEGLFFSASFAAIFWLKDRGLMAKGLAVSNQLISTDEGLHTDFACLMYHKLGVRLTDAEAHEMIATGVDIETSFIEGAIRRNMIGMNVRMMSQYVQYVADRLLVQLGHPTLYGAQNPFDFMSKIALTSNVNFFEQRNVTYQNTTNLKADDLDSAFDSL